MINEEKLLYQVIYYENDKPSGIIETEHYYDEPTEQVVRKMMVELNSSFSQVYYDKYDTEEYDELVCEYTEEK